MKLFPTSFSTVPALVALIFVFGTLSASAQQATGSGHGVGVLLSGASDDDPDPVMEIGTPVATRSVTVVFHHITPGTYTVGINKADGTPVKTLSRYLQNDVPMVIDIEKVETGVYVLYAIIDGRTISGSFTKVD